MWKLAWKFIKYDRARYVGIITAIVISIFLIGQQVGLLLFLMGLMGNLVGNSNVNEKDIWVIESQTANANTLNKIDQRYVQQLKSIPGVAQTYGVVIASGEARFLDGNTAGVTRSEERRVGKEWRVRRETKREKKKRETRK